MSTRYPPQANEDWIREGSPTGLRVQSMRQLDISTDLAALTSQVMTSVFLPLQPGDLVTNLTFKSGATAANTPTNWWVALYDASGALLGQSADQTNTAWAANTEKTVALATPKRISTAGAYAALMVKASTPPSILGRSVALAGGAAAIAGGVVLAQTSGSSLTDTAPATIATPTTVATVPFAIAT